MKTKFFLMFASAAMLLAACSKDDIGSGGDDSGIVTDPKGDINILKCCLYMETYHG